MWMWMWAFTCASIFLPSVVLYWSFGIRGGGSLNSRFLALECKHSNVQAFSYLRLSSGDGDALNPRLRACECECELHMCIVSLVSIITFGWLLMMVRFLWWWFSKPSFGCMHMLMLMWALPCTLCCSKHSHLLCCGDSSVPVVVVLLTLGCVHANVSIHMCFVAVAKHFLTFVCFVMMVRFWLWWCAHSSIAWMWIWEFTCASIFLPLVVLWRWFSKPSHVNVSSHMCIVALGSIFAPPAVLWWCFGSGCGCAVNPQLCIWMYVSIHMCIVGKLELYCALNPDLHVCFRGLSGLAGKCLKLRTTLLTLA